METIVIPDSGKESTPIEELHFWKWLEDGGYTDYYAVAPDPDQSTLRNYIARLGQEFPQAGVTRFANADLQLLRSVYQVFAWRKYNYA